MGFIAKDRFFNQLLKEGSLKCGSCRILVQGLPKGPPRIWMVVVSNPRLVYPLFAQNSERPDLCMYRVWSLGANQSTIQFFPKKASGEAYPRILLRKPSRTEYSESLTYYQVARRPIAQGSGSRSRCRSQY